MAVLRPFIVETALTYPLLQPRKISFPRLVRHVHAPTLFSSCCTQCSITTMIPNTLRTSRSFSSAFDFAKFAGLTGGAFDRCRRRRRRREGGSVGRGSCCSGRRKSGWSVCRCWCCGVASNKAVKSVSENKSGRKTFSVAFLYGCEALAPS